MSFLTEADYIELIANMKHDMEKEFQCKHSDRFKDFKDPEKAKEAHKIVNFCDKQVSSERPSFKHYYDGINFLTCMCSFHNPQIAKIVELEQIYDKFGPQNIYSNRDIGQFPSKLLQSFRIIRKFLNEKEKEMMKEHEKEMKRMEKMKK